MQYVTLDFETYYDSIQTLKKLMYEEYIGSKKFKVHGVGIKINDGESVWYTGTKEELTAIIAEILSRDETTLIAHNMLFDGAILSWYYGLKADKYLCTQAMSRAIWAHASSSLDSLAIRCFPQDESIRKGHELADFKGVWTLDEEQDRILGGYCNNDVDVTFACFAEMWKYFPEEELQSIHDTLIMFIHRTLKLDRNAVEAYLKFLEEDQIQKVKASGLPREILASSDKLAEWIKAQGIPFEKIHSPTPKNPDNHKWPLSKDALEFIDIRTNYPEHEAVWLARLCVASTQERSRSKRLLTATQADLCNPEELFGIPLNYAAAHTLRWGGTNSVNAQNFGRGSALREAIQAPPGYKLIVSDLSNIEARLLAWAAEDPRLLQIYAEDGDPYCDLASIIFGRTITKADYIERLIGKVCVLGLGYGMGAKRLRNQLAIGAMGADPIYITEGDAINYVQTFQGTYAGIPRYWGMCDSILLQMLREDCDTPTKAFTARHNRILMPSQMFMSYPDLSANATSSGGHVVTYNNGKFRKKLWGGSFTENIIQNLARIVMRDAWSGTNKMLAQYGDPMMKVVMQVHDEIIVMARDDLVPEIIPQVETIMTTAPNWCSDLPLKVESAYADYYAKG